MAKNEKRIAVTLECQVCKRRNYITTKNKVNDRCLLYTSPSPRDS